MQAAALWLEVGDVRHGHVVGNIQCLDPLLPPVHGAGAKASALKLSRVFVDALRPLQELPTVVKQLTVMIQVVNVDFVPSATEAINAAGET